VLINNGIMERQQRCCSSVLCVRRPPKSHFSLKRRSQQRLTSSAPGPGTILQKEAAAADDSEAWVKGNPSGYPVAFCQLIMLYSGRPVRANERSRCVRVKYLPIYMYTNTSLHTRAYIYYALFMCILYVIILLLRSRCTCRREKKITLDDGQRNKKTADSKIII